MKTKISIKKYPLKKREDSDYYPVTTKNGHICCPNCGHVKFIFGPEGGASQNIQCTSCFKYWNYIGVFGFQEIGDRSEVFGMNALDQQKEKIFQETVGPRSNEHE